MSDSLINPKTFSLVASNGSGAGKPALIVPSIVHCSIDSDTYNPRKEEDTCPSNSDIIIHDSYDNRFDSPSFCDEEASGRSNSFHDGDTSGMLDSYDASKHSNSAGESLGSFNADSEGDTSSKVSKK